MTSYSEVVREVLSALESAGVPYMVVGSFAASIYGVSRATHDLDVVVALTPDAVTSLQAALGDGFYFDELSAQEALERSDMFNILHIESGLKVDFWILGRDDYSRTQFERRRPTETWGIKSYVASPEDTVLSKLLWYRITPSDRQLADVRDVLIVEKGELDYEYMAHWAETLGVQDLLDRLIKET